MANIIWHLSGGPRRFNELRVDMPRISSKVLATRLRELTGKGVVFREVKPTSPPSVEYYLTEPGRELMSAIEVIAAVGKKLKKTKILEVDLLNLRWMQYSAGVTWQR